MKRLSVLLVLAAAACSNSGTQTGAVRPAATADAAATITATDITARVRFLASDALRGRDTPSPGLEVAAAYIASEFERLGLEPGAGDGSFLQRYPYTVRTLHGDSTRLIVSTAGETSTHTFGTAVFAWAGSAARAHGPVTFLGRRVPESAQLRGRVPAIFVPGTPDRAWRTAVLNARRAAHAAGAEALIVVLDPALDQAAVQRFGALFSTTLSATPVAATMFWRYDRARAAFGRADADLDALVARAASAAVEQPLAQTTVTLELPVVEVVHQPPNVVGILRGSDPALRESYVVLSAHMDHVGVGAPDARGDSIYNGADDDASGTSAVLEVAEAFAAASRPARSIIFLLVSGEEKGLLGSQYFVENPIVPHERMVANINLDMVARNAPDTIVAIGQDYSSLGPLAAEIARSRPELGLVLARDPWPQERFFFRSDHFNFARREIPAIFFFAGVHDDYHRPSDEIARIDADKAARVARLTYYLAQEIASRREPPRWTTQGLNEVRALTR